MRNALHALALALYSAGATTALAAQSQPAAPMFNVLSIYRETVKPGKGPEHDAHEEAWARAAGAAMMKNQIPMLAVGAMTGTTEIWYMNIYPTWNDLEKAAATSTPEMDAVDKRFSMKEGEYLNDGRRMILRLRRDLSYGPEADLVKMRYFSVTRISVRPGHAAEYEENRKMIKAAHEAARLSDSYRIWEVASGAPAGTFLLMVARQTLAELDSGDVVHGPAYLEKLGGEAAQKKMAANQASAVISSETNNFRFLPQQSIPPAEWVTADPKYWGRKPAPKKVP
jgi:hypothetical protein